ncbi:MAG: acetolactate synthase small subunit [Clostridiales Family XIII bacterium]|jgi:acetolactate synthase-1/3 small subunit|nr:acetolactate synthase small subunit [Clostridiales Family XIII bacterium]
MKHYISALVENKAGVLARISGLFARRGFNIDSLAVGETDDTSVSRVTIVVDGDDYIAEQVTKQLSKLIDVRTVRQLNAEAMVQRDLVLVKVKIDPDRRGEIYDLVKIMNCEIVDISHTTLMIEFDDRTPKVNLLLDLLSKYEILELVRTGTIALQKGEGTVYDEEEF